MNLRFLQIALLTTLLAGAAASQAASNPFQMTELQGLSKNTSLLAEAKCGAGACGSKAKDKDGDAKEHHCGSKAKGHQCGSKVKGHHCGSKAKGHHCGSKAHHEHKPVNTADKHEHGHEGHEHDTHDASQ